MKRLLTMVLALILLLTGCSLRFTLPEETEARLAPITSGTGQEDTTPAQTPRQTDENGATLVTNISVRSFTLANGGAEVQTCAYDGGEMCLPFQYQGGPDTDLAGLGLMVFLDGQPQPYKLKEDGPYEYMHIFTKQAGEGNLYFTPVCGKAGEKLEICAVLLTAPDWLPQERREDGQVKLADYSNPYQSYMATGVILQFNADPTPAADFPAVRDRVEDLTISQESWTDYDQTDIIQNIYIGDITDSMDISSDIRYIQRRAWNVYMGSLVRWGVGKEEEEPKFLPTWGGQFAYNIKETSKVNFKCQVYCEMPVDYSFVLFVNDKPVTVEPEKAIHFTGGEIGIKTVVTFALDMTEMSEINRICVMAVARNYQTLYQQGELGEASCSQLGFRIIPMYTILTSYANYNDYEKAVY